MRLLAFTSTLLVLRVYANIGCDNCGFPMNIVNETLATRVAFAEANIFRNVLINAPQGYLRVIFETAEAQLGNFIDPVRTILPPQIIFDNVDPSNLYTVVVTDIDVPSVVARRLSSYLIFLAINLNCSLNLDSGLQVSPWTPPGTVPGSGDHRYVVSLYQQAGRINYRNFNLINLGRFPFRFNENEFAANYSLGTPIAGNFWRGVIPLNYDKYCTVATPTLAQPCINNKCK